VGKLVVAGRILRIIQLFRIIRVILRKDVVVDSIKLQVVGNKKGYKKFGYNLDLCYITKNVIAMSFPASGLEKLYRNKIDV